LERHGRGYCSDQDVDQKFVSVVVVVGTEVGAIGMKGLTSVMVSIRDIGAAWKVGQGVIEVETNGAGGGLCHGGFVGKVISRCSGSSVGGEPIPHK
jgi:hypothetical protein